MRNPFVTSSKGIKVVIVYQFKVFLSLKATDVWLLIFRNTRRSWHDTENSETLKLTIQIVQLCRFISSYSGPKR